MYEHPLTILKKVFSMFLLIYSIVVLSVMIFEKQTRLADEVHPALAFVALVLSLVWLARVEGAQASMVGLPPVDRSLYKDSHPIAYRVCELAHKGDNLDRFLMGRQFMVLALVFVINMAGSPAEDAETRTEISHFFLKSGLATILVTAMIGQLNTQVTASHCMLDYTNTRFMTFTLYVTLAIEASGILHSSYMIHILVSKLTGTEIISNEPERNIFQKLLFWGRVLMSSGILVVAFWVTLAALFEEKTSMWEGVPATVSVVIFFVLMAIVGMLEGMQIAFFAVSRITEKERNKNPWCNRACDLLFGNDGKGLAGFMIGRQLCVASCFIVIARITTTQLEDGEDNILGVSDSVQKFFDTGLLGAIITTIVASIAWQLVASTFPITFLGNPITYLLLRVCLLLELTGICSFVWVLSSIHQEFLGFEDDEVHIGTAEEREALGKGDTHRKEGGLTGGAFPANFGIRETKYLKESVTMEDLKEHMTELHAQVRRSKTDEERDALRREIAYLEKLMRKHEQKKHLKLANAESDKEKETTEDVGEGSTEDSNGGSLDP